MLFVLLVAMDIGLDNLTFIEARNNLLEQGKEK
jgi:hypothetical protein